MHSAFSYLDQVEFRDLFCLPETPQTMRFYVEGIRCAKCVAKIEALTQTSPELRSLQVDLSSHIARVQLRDSQDSFHGIAERISDLGFRPVALKALDNSDQAWKRESRQDLVRLGIAGFCAGNIMMLAFAIYFGLEEPLRSLFQWLQLALYLPVVTFVAKPFYQGFWHGLKQRSLTIDSPMAMASFFAFAISTWNLYQGEGSIYFDSTSSFLFLILATRTIQKFLRHRYLAALRPTALLEGTKARKVTFGPDASTGKATWVRADRLIPGDEIEVHPGEWVPADGQLLSESGVLDMSLLNGENLPRSVQKNFRVAAGSVVLGPAVRLRVEKVGQSTLFGHLMNSIRNEGIEKTEYHRLSDRASQWLLITVFSVAAIVLLIPGTDFKIQFEKALALIVLACPCAMAFGTPLAFSFSLQRAFKKGILVKTATVFEKILKARTLLIDKTGTLTRRFWEIHNSSLQIVPDEYKQVILALETTSTHPIAFAFRESWKQMVNPHLQVSEFVEHRGRGVQGRIQQQSWELNAMSSDLGKQFVLCREGLEVWRFAFEPSLQVETAETIQYFKSQGYKVALLSGDHQSEVEKMGEQLGIHKDNLFFELSPLDKQKIVQSSTDAIMIGDGYNDSLAMQEASVGIAVLGGVDLAVKAASVVFLNEGLSSLKTLIEISKNADRQIRRNLALALVYNLLGGTAAVSGLINPYIAALLMPASSLVILGFTWWGTAREDL